MAGKLEEPGEFPYTRGIYPEMYRKRLWTMRQYSGYGDSASTNSRFKYLLEHGETGLSCAFDLPTQLGFDREDPRAAGEVGLAGVSLNSYADFQALFADIPLDKISVSFTINATAPIILAMYLLLAEERRVPWTELRGTLQNDPLKEFTARGAWIIPPVPALAMATAVNAFCLKNLPKFNPLSVSGYHLREAGASAVQEVAFTLAAALEYLDALCQAGFTAAEAAVRFSFFWAVGSELFPEAAKLRAARRLWAKLLAEKYGLTGEAAKMRFHTQTAGSTLKAVNPLDNISRVTIETLAAVLGGTQSHHACSYDEALNLPSAEAARISLAIQQIIASESGVTAAADPLGGSYYLENLTDELESGARLYLAEITRRGGSLAALDYQAAELDGHRREHYVQLDATPPPPVSGMLIPDIMTALAKGATVGQIAENFRQTYGLYREPGFYPAAAPLLLAKVGLDGHDVGLRVINSALTAAGYQVAYSGRRRTVGELLELIEKMPVKILGLSSLSGAHMAYWPELLEKLPPTRHIMTMAGGLVPEEDILTLKKLGLAAFFGPGSDPLDVVSWVKTILPLSPVPAC